MDNETRVKGKKGLGKREQDRKGKEKRGKAERVGGWEGRKETLHFSLPAFICPTNAT